MFLLWYLLFAILVGLLAFHRFAKTPAGNRVSPWYYHDLPTVLLWITAADHLMVRILGRSFSPVTEEQLMRDAKKRVSFQDFGDMYWLKGFRILLKGLNTDPHISFIGRLNLKLRLQRGLRTILKVRKAFQEHPELADIEVNPICITGLPRTGSTLVQRLMALDPSCRSPQTWELTTPFPPPKAETYHRDSRIPKLAKTLVQGERILPHLMKKHEVRATTPEECILAMEHFFYSPTMTLCMTSPTGIAYAEWMTQEVDVLLVYQDLKRIYQVLSWRHPPKSHWLIKSPAHAKHVEIMAKVFPGIRFIQTHREPRKTVPSVCSLLTSVNALYERRANLNIIASRTNDSQTMKAIQRFRDTGACVWCDVSYRGLISVPVVQLTQVYRQLELPLSKELKAAWTQYLRDHPQKKYGVHTYKAEDYDLTDALIDAEFATYEPCRTMPTKE